MVDPTDEEEDVAGATVTCAVDEFGQLCGTYKTGATPVTDDLLETLLVSAKKRASDMRTMLHSTG